MQVYFDLVHRDTGHSSNGSTWLVIANYYTMCPEVHPMPILSHDCGTYPEFNLIVERMIEDLKRLRNKAKRHFEQLERLPKHWRSKV
jgi:hypothetical protein